MPEHIQDLPLLVAKSEMEVAPGWQTLATQPGVPTWKGWGAGTCHTDRTSGKKKRVVREEHQ